MTDLLLTWACSYLLHSSLLIGGLWLAERRGLLARLTTTTQETLWRLALLGGLVSASLPLMAPLASSPLPAAGPTPLAVDSVPAPLPRVDAPAAAAALPPVPPTAQLGALPVASPLVEQAHDLALGAVAVWLAGATVLLLGLAVHWAWLRRAVRRLPPLVDRGWQSLAARVSTELGVPAPSLRHGHPRWASPLLAPGRVLCLPAWCLTLPDDEARAVLGHELAHLRRRDPAWRLLAALLNALLWPQALNRLALRRLDLLAELACDAAAAEPSGQRLALAQSLLRCAEALKADGARHGPALACGAASAGSPLLARVRRLLHADTEGEPREARGVRWGLVGVILLGLLALPAVVVSHTDGRRLLDRLDLPVVGDSLDFMTRGTRIYSRYPGGSLRVTLDGQVGFNEAEDDIQTLTGTLKVVSREGGLTREMRLTSMGEGRIERQYRVGDAAQAMDDAGQRWWAQTVQRIAADLTDPVVRARKLFARGGIEAVLTDVDRARDDFQRRRRIEAALQVADPLPAGALDGLTAAAARLQGAFERREALSAIARQPMSEAQQRAWLIAVAGIDSDFERREALQALAPQLLDTPAVLAAWTDALRRIGGDFEKRSAIDTQVSATPRPAVLGAALQAAAGLGGDFEKREALVAVADRLQGDEAELVQVYTRVAGGIGGSFERREALNRLLDRPRLDSAGLAGVLGSAEQIDSGFERLQVLLRVAEKLGQHKPVDAALVERLRRAGRGLSDHERGQIENALDRLG
jgi:beta-lactamase regulating signal transducer with metallopeptidase domain